MHALVIKQKPNLTEIMHRQFHARCAVKIPFRASCIFKTRDAKRLKNPLFDELAKVTP